MFTFSSDRVTPTGHSLLLQKTSYNNILFRLRHSIYYNLDTKIVKMAQNILTILFFCLLALPAAVDAKSPARLRGKHFDALEAIVRNPKIDAHIRGKTLKDLGIEQSINKEDQARRKTQTDDDTLTLKYFSVRIQKYSSLNRTWQRRRQRQQKRNIVRT
jgi:hypothetical protein